MHSGKNPRRMARLLLTAGLTLCLAACAQPPAPAQSGVPQSAPNAAPVVAESARILFINVGKADAALLQAGGCNYLIDTGEKDSVPALFGALNLMDAARLDGVFLTHTHSDHMGGAAAICTWYPVQRLYCAEITQLDKKGKNRFETLSEQTGVPLTKLQAGDVLPIPGAHLEVLGPLTENAEDDNDNSLILRVTLNGKSLLFTGDMQFAEEASLLQAGVDVAADILKVGNHGNPDATGADFAAAVSPEVAVISTDTREDTDSANPRVRSALQGAAVYLTEDHAMGVLVTISPAGEITVGQMDVPPASLTLRIEKIDKAAQTVTVRNAGGEADLSGCMLYSAKGGELYVFPAGTTLAPGESLTIGCEGGGGDLLWPGETAVWKKNKTDTGSLYDRYGRLLDSLDA